MVKINDLGGFETPPRKIFRRYPLFFKKYIVDYGMSKLILKKEKKLSYCLIFI
jgi:hypothetical protein